MPIILSKKAGGGGGGSPTGPAGGDLSGTYPNPDIGAGAVGRAELATGVAVFDLIEDVHLGADQANIDFQNIPQTYKHLLIELLVRGDVAATSTVLVARFNADSGSNYDWERAQFASTAAAISQGTGVTLMEMGQVCGSTSPANAFAGGSLRVPDYADAASRKTMLGEYSLKLADSAGNHIRGSTAGFYRTAGAVSRITLIPGSGNLVSGSRATLYGLG